MQLDIEVDLKQGGEAYKTEVLDHLSQTANEVRLELNRGVDPDEYERLNTLLTATNMAMTVIQEY